MRFTGNFFVVLVSFCVVSLLFCSGNPDRPVVEPDLLQTNFPVEQSMLVNHRCTNMAFDSRGAAWISTMYGELIQLDGDNVHVFSPENSNFPACVIYDIAVDRNDHVWLATSEGLVYNDGADFEQVTRTNPDLPDRYCQAVAVDKDNTVWAASWIQLMKYDGTAWEVKTAHSVVNFQNPTYSIITDIAVDESNTVWFVYRPMVLVDVIENEFTIATHSGGRWKAVSVPLQREQTDYITKIKTGSDNRIYFLNHTGSSHDILGLWGNEWHYIDAVDENGQDLGEILAVEPDAAGGL